MRLPRRPAATLLLAAIALFAGCEGSDEPPPEPTPTETADELPRLPDGWRPYDNRAQGFALGLPPGWSAGKRCTRGAGRSARSRATLICSPDRLVSVSITADRTDEALDVPPRSFAVRAIERLGEEQFSGRLDIGRPRPFRGEYEGARIAATGTARGTDFEQRLEVVVIRRPELANFTAVIASNAERPAPTGAAERMLRTLRSHPVGAPAAQSRSGRSG